MPPRATSRQAVPWRIYLLIDPSTKPTNHPLGTIFYVGLRSELPQPVDLREAVQWQSLPEDEGPARDRLTRLTQEGARVLVEVVPEQDWPNTQGGIDRTVAALCSALHPAPLNVRHRGLRWPASLAQLVENPPTAPLPEGGAIIRRHQGEVRVAELPLLEQDALFREHVEFVEGTTSPRTIANRVDEGGPLPLLLVAQGRRQRGVLPSNFVLGAWMVERIAQVTERRWRVVRAEGQQTEAALRRRYLGTVIDPREDAALSLRKA